MGQWNDNGPLERGLYVPVLIGGMPRSGTTSLSALISTSSLCNPFAPEPHYLGYLANALPNLFLPNQSCFYRDKEEQLRQHFRFFRTVLDEAWVTLGRPKILVVKHVLFTPVCGIIGQHLPQARFLAIMRDPRDVFASMLRTRVRHQPTAHIDRSDLEDYVVQWIIRFNKYYLAVLSAATNGFRGRLLAVDHESMCRGIIGPIGQFLGLSDIDPDKLWNRSVFDITQHDDDPMFSDGWGKPLHTGSSRSRGNELDEEVAHTVDRDTRVVRSMFLDLVSGSALKKTATLETT